MHDPMTFEEESDRGGYRRAVLSDDHKDDFAVSFIIETYPTSDRVYLSIFDLDHNLAEATMSQEDLALYIEKLQSFQKT